MIKTQFRRQSGLVCSLLVVSLLLSAAVGEGELSDLAWSGCVYIVDVSDCRGEVWIS